MPAQKKVTKVTQAACALHNYLKISELHSPASSQLYCPPGYIDHEDSNGNVVHGDRRLFDGNEGLGPVSRLGSNRCSKNAAEFRDEMMNYLISPEGAVSWQNHRIHST